MERLINIEVTEDGTVMEEIEIICTMTGIRTRYLYHWLGDGYFQSVDLGTK